MTSGGFSTFADYDDRNEEENARDGMNLMK